jgi:hypothetical protein
MRMDRNILPYVACSALPYFALLFHKWQEIRKRNTKHKLCFDVIFSRTSHLTRIPSDIIYRVYIYICICISNVHSLHLSTRYSLLVKIKLYLNILHRFSKNIQTSKFHEIPSSGSRVVPYGQTDGHTGRN